MGSPEEFAAEIIKQLDTLAGDPEGDHSEADALVEAALGVLGGDLGKQIVDAVERVRKRAGGWWYA